jgi:hypothetical protein
VIIKVRIFGLVRYALDRALAKLTGRLSDTESYLVVKYGKKMMAYGI